MNCPRRGFLPQPEGHHRSGEQNYPKSPSRYALKPSNPSSHSQGTGSVPTATGASSLWRAQYFHYDLLAVRTAGTTWSRRRRLATSCVMPVERGHRASCACKRHHFFRWYSPGGTKPARVTRLFVGNRREKAPGGDGRRKSWPRYGDTRTIDNRDYSPLLSDD